MDDNFGQAYLDECDDWRNRYDEAINDMKKYVIVDKDNVPLRDELETNGLVIFNDQCDAEDSIAWLIEDVSSNAWRGLRVEIYDPVKHGVPDDK
jgi:hypothetical protein